MIIMTVDYVVVVSFFQYNSDEAVEMSIDGLGTISRWHFASMSPLVSLSQ